MIKKHLLFLFSVCIAFSSYALPKEDSPIMVCEFCELVYERTYFLGRLEKILHLFQTFNEHHKINTNLSGFNPNQFDHPRIKKLIISLENSNCMGALFSLWNELHEYKYINDEKLMKEFSHLILIVTKKLCPICYARTVCPSDVMFNLAEGSYTEAITLRNYCVKRLEKPFQLLNKIKCSKESVFEAATDDTTCNCIFESHLKFQHSEINKCIENMEKDNSLKPLINLFQEFKRFQLIQDEKFNKEFLLLIFGVFKNLITYNAKHKDISINKSTLDLIVNLYANLDKLPLEQILETIDLLSQELPQLLEDYEIQPDINWKEWLKKHWWVPPLVFTTLGIKVFLIFKYAMPTGPRPPRPPSMGPGAIQQGQPLPGNFPPGHDSEYA